MKQNSIMENLVCFGVAILFIGILVFAFAMEDMELKNTLNDANSIVVDKMITYNKYGDPCYYLIINNNGKVGQYEVMVDEYYNREVKGDK